jgi:nucleoid-associated protein YgaU
VKVGLIAGVVVIGAALLFWFNKGSGSGQPADHIPWNAGPEQAKPRDGAVSVSDTGKGAARMPGAHASRTPPKGHLTRHTPPAPARSAERGAASSQPLPPLVTTPRAVATPPTEPCIAAEHDSARPPARQQQTDAPASPGAAPLRHETDATSPGAEPVQPRAAEPAHTAEADTQQPLRVGPLPHAAPPSPVNRRIGSPTSAAQPQSDATTAATPGVPVPPRPVETMRVDEPAMRLRDAKPKPEPVRYTVEESDTLTYIARQKYGDGKYWTKIRDANPGIDPDHLLVGQVLILPPKEEVTGAARSPAAARTDATSTRATRTYVVATGDSLITIARNVLGDGSRWREIYNLNRDKIKNPDILLEGTELKLPENGAKTGGNGARAPANRAKKPALRKTKP